jgi:hypothetical protein
VTPFVRQYGVQDLRRRDQRGIEHDVGVDEHLVAVRCGIRPLRRGGLRPLPVGRHPMMLIPSGPPFTSEFGNAGVAPS